MMDGHPYRNNNIMTQNNLRPSLPYISYIIETSSKGNKNTYYNSENTGNTVIKDLQAKWSEKLNDNVSFDTLTSSFTNAKKFSPSVYQHFIQYKLLHRRVVHNKLLHNMGISETPNCLYCNNLETIEHVYIECANVRQLWSDTENWLRNLHYTHFKISDFEKLFGERFNDHLKHIAILSTKDVIYQKRKSGEEMHISDVKRAILKNPHITKTQEIMQTDVSNSDENWKILIECLRIDPATQDSWYKL